MATVRATVATEETVRRYFRPDDRYFRWPEPKQQCPICLGSKTTPESYGKNLGVPPQYNQLNTHFLRPLEQGDMAHNYQKLETTMVRPKEKGKHVGDQQFGS